MRQRVSIFGTGNWGVSLADVAQRSGAEVMLFARREEVFFSILTERRHPEYLPHVAFNEHVYVTQDIKQAAAYSDNWLLVVPSQHMRQLGEGLKPYLTDDKNIVSCAKGFEESTALRMTQVLHDVFNGHNVYPSLGVMSGPNLAFDVSRGLPTATVLAGEARLFHALVSALGNANLRLYHQTDVTGVELGGALKNILAIAVGMAHSANLGESAKATIMTRGLHEMGRLAVYLGANWMTLAGLSGLGDLVATASSTHSRNRWCGEELGKGRALQEILNSTSMVVEGVPAASVALSLGQKFSIPMPITEQVVEIFSGKSINDAVRDLMARVEVSESEL